jgi:3-hydroxyisobutyrate dehydrogenase-like beta-hydroxyacid dehydrogenase
MVALGAKGASSSREVASASDAIITMVRDIKQTDEVIFGKDGVWEGIKKGSIIIISSSIGPKYCQELYARAKKKGVKVVDCGISDPSGTAHYLEGELTLMIGGDEDDVKRCWPIFEAMGKNIFHLGEIGKGQAYKLVNNMVAMHVGSIARECLNLGLKMGLDTDKMAEVMSVSSGSTWMFQNQARVKKLGIKMPAMRRPDIGAAGTGPPSERRMPFELQMAWEMADELGVEMPVCKFIDGLGR